jgi:serine protease
MSKRAANRFGSSLLRRLQLLGKAISPALSESRFSCRPVPEALESRMMLSSSPPTVTVMWDGQSLPAVQDQYVVQSNNVPAFFNVAGAKGFTGITSLGGTGYYQFTSDLSPAQIKQLGQAHPAALASVEPNFMNYAASTVPSDAYFPYQWYLQNTGQAEPFDYNLDNGLSGTLDPNEPFETPHDGTVGLDDDATAAWDVTTGSSNVYVAILDTGVDITNPDLAPNAWTNPNPNGQPGFPDDVNGWNFVSNDNDVLDDEGHGTNVAGIIGGVGNNGFGIAGLNWHVTIIPVKVLGADGSGTEADIISGVNYVTMLKSQGINIVAMNESLGGPSFPFNIVESNAVKAAGKAGVLDVVAAGNSGVNLDNPSVTGSAPANLSLNIPTVITVAAIDNQGTLARFSNYGAQTVDLAAPGINILSTAPTYAVTSAPTLSNGDDPTFSVTVAPEYGFESGTSQATPQVTGVIALEAAANPSATPAQLKAALLNGTTFDPALASVNGLPAKVATSGRLNAFLAVENIRNQFITSDTTRGGNWHSAYGYVGSYIVGDSTNFPSFVNVNFQGGTPVILQTSTKKAAALQKASNPADRVSAFEASTTNEIINLDFTDDNIHRVRLYVADLDNKNRVETIQLIDTATDSVLSSQTVSKFKNGEYLTYDLQGSVQLTITNDSGPSAVFSGIFFDLTPQTPAAVVNTDTTTKGSQWASVYGSQGSYIIADNNTGTLPSYVTSVAATGATTKVLAASTSNARALQKNVDFNHNIEAYDDSATNFSVNLTVNDTAEHQVTLYLADYDHKKRIERVLELNPTTGALLAAQDVANFSNGQFISFNITGSVTFEFQNIGGPNAVLSGIFFDAPPGSPLNFTGIDTTTAGNWQASGFGPTNAYIVGQNFPGLDDPLNPSFTVLGGTEKVLADPSANPRALQLVGGGIGNPRIEAYLFTSTKMTLEYTPADNLQHSIELYFADYENFHRSESVIFSDPATGAVLAKQRITNFAKGKYYLYNLSGPVDITIVNGSYPNAVFSGLFTD